jgi:hypothetical protein
LISGAGFYIESPPRNQWDDVTQCYAVHAFRLVAELTGDDGWNTHGDQLAAKGPRDLLRVTHGGEARVDVVRAVSHPGGWDGEAYGTEGLLRVRRHADARGAGEYECVHPLKDKIVILSVLAKDLRGSSSARSFASTLRMTLLLTNVVYTRYMIRPITSSRR